MHIDCIVRIERHLFLVKLAEVQMVRIFKTAIVIFGSRTDIENIPILEIADELSRRYIFICIVVILFCLPCRDDQLKIVISDGSEILLQHPAVFRVADKDRKSTRLNSSHVSISYAVFCLYKKRHK